MATTPASAATPQLATIDVPAEKMASASLSYPFNIAWFSEYFHEVGEMGGADGLNLKFASSVCKDPEALPNLVKEIRKLETSAMTTGNPVVWGSDAAVWFVMVKDAKGRFASNPLWGDGWGWALFKADAPAKNVAVSYEADCMGCHVPAAKTDRVFIQGYPTLTQH